MKLLLATDAWHPQVNGVVRTLSTVIGELRAQGHSVEVVHTGEYPSLPMPSYPEIRLAYWTRGLWQRIEAFDPDAIHISTEGPIGWRVRNGCVKRGLAFTTSLHSRFPEYVAERAPIPLSWSYAMMRRFHRPAVRTLVPTPSFQQDLEQWDFEHLQVWGRGVDPDVFSPEHRADLELPRPILLCVGRIAPEKNLLPFLELDHPGTKILVGDGPQCAAMKEKYPDVVFPGYKYGEELARYYASADVFVFPSLTDTFGLVMLEAIACGTPVAAYPVTGPRDVVQHGLNGILDQDLNAAVRKALVLDRSACAASAEAFTWRRITNQFLGALTPLSHDKHPAFEPIHG